MGLLAGRTVPGGYSWTIEAVVIATMTREIFAFGLNANFLSRLSQGSAR
jgi:hypothetical protein